MIDLAKQAGEPGMAFMSVAHWLLIKRGAILGWKQYPASEPLWCVFARRGEAIPRPEKLPADRGGAIPMLGDCWVADTTGIYAWEPLVRYLSGSGRSYVTGHRPHLVARSIEEFLDLLAALSTANNREYAACTTSYPAEPLP